MKKNPIISISVLIGILIGYPLSYFFQPGALRMKITLQDYIVHIGDVLKDNNLRGTAIGTWIGCVIISALLGRLLAAVASKKDSNP